MTTFRKYRFPVILLGSLVFHVAVLGLIYASYIHNVFLKFGSIEFGSDGEARYKVTMLDRTKPLYLPKGFYAIEKPPEEIKKHDERPKTDKPEKDKKAEKRDEKDDQGLEDEQAKDEKKDETKPPGDMKFGHISGGAFKPHIQQLYTAYQEGRLSVREFTVTVSCKAQPDGSLTDIEVVKSSGDKAIDATAVTLFKELSAMHALAPLSQLSSLSLTFEKTASSSALTAVGFANDPDVTNGMANQLGTMKMLARFGAKNPDQATLIDNIAITTSGNRVSVRLGLPNAAAGEMMKRSFGGQDTASR